MSLMAAVLGVSRATLLGRGCGFPSFIFRPPSRLGDAGIDGGKNIAPQPTCTGTSTAGILSGIVFWTAGMAVASEFQRRILPP